MFDIGFWEMVLVAVVALVVVGPKELPGLIRGVSTWVGRARAIAGEFRDEFNREVARADEFRTLVERETDVAEVREAIDEARKSIAVDGVKRADAVKPADSAAPAGAAAPERNDEPAPR